MILYATTVFLSAFLLFQVQPLIGKYILPWFGGTSSVWSTSLPSLPPECRGTTTLPGRCSGPTFTAICCGC